MKMHQALPDTPHKGSLIGLPRAVEIWFCVLALLVIAGYTFVWQTAPVEVSDSAGYFEVARDLVDFRLDKLHFRPPGYPLLLRLLGFTDYRATKLLIVVGLCLYMLGLWMLTLVLYRLELSRLTLAFFALVLCLPPFVEPAAYVLSENLVQILLISSLTAIMFWFWRRHQRYLLLAGGSLAAAALTKPTYQALAFALAVCLALTTLILAGEELRLRQALTAGGALILLSSLPVFGFSFFNYYSFGQFTMSPGNLSYSLSTKTVKVLERIPDGYATAREAMITARNEHLVERGSSHTAEQYYPSAKAAVAEVTGLEGRELDALLLRLNLTLIAKAPLNYALHVAQSAAGYWFPATGTINTGGSKFLHLAWASLHFTVVAWFFLQLTVLGGLGIFELSRRLALRQTGGDAAPRATAAQVTAYALALTVILYTMAVSCLVHHGESRFRTVTDPMIVFLCFLGSSIWWRLLPGGRTGPGA